MSYVATDLGGLPGASPSGGTISRALGVSGNGSLVVGISQDAGGVQRPVFWNAAGQIHELASLGGGGTNDFANGCSDDGLTIVGQSDPGTGFPVAVVWRSPSWNVVNLGVLAGATFPGSAAFGCSGDGSIIVGQSADASTGTNGERPCVWVNGAIEPLPLVGGTGLGVAAGCSLTGSVIVGECQTFTTLIGPATSWAGSSFSLTALQRLGTPAVSDQAYACNFNGSIAVGIAWDDAFNNYAASWTPTVHKIGTAGSSALGCDATGTYVVGFGATGAATLWINGSGQNLAFFAGQTAVGQAAGISYDATTISGWGTDASHHVVAVKWMWSAPGGTPPPGNMPWPPTPVPPGTPIFPLRFLVCEPTGWTLTQPVQTVYGLDHLASMYVIGVADGVLIGPLLVSSDGAVTLPFPASAIILGMSFTPQVQTTDLDAGTPTIQGRRKDILAVTARVKSSLGVQVGANQPDGAALDPPQNAPAWSGMQTIQTPAQSPSYISPSGQLVTLPITGDLYASIPGAWDVPGQVAIQGTPGLPLYLTACIPEILEGDTVEQTYAKAPEQGRRAQQKRGERPVPGMWMIGGDA